MEGQDAKTSPVKLEGQDYKISPVKWDGGDGKTSRVKWDGQNDPPHRKSFSSKFCHKVQILQQLVNMSFLIKTNPELKLVSTYPH